EHATDVRELYIAYLTGECHADPERRHRIAEQQAEQARIAEEARLARVREEMAQRERDQQMADERARRDAEADGSRRQASLQVRGDMVAYLVSLGAVEHPPEPAPEPTEPPGGDIV